MFRSAVISKVNPKEPTQPPGVKEACTAVLGCIGAVMVEISKSQTVVWTQEVAVAVAESSAKQVNRLTHLVQYLNSSFD